MKKDDTYWKMIQILKEELVPALGCTEPIAIAFAAARAAETLGGFPDEMVVECSGNIIKNVKGVIVPNTGNLRGIKASAIAGALAGDSSKKLEVLSGITTEQIRKTRELLDAGFCTEKYLKTSEPLHIIVSAQKGNDRVRVELMKNHTGIVSVEKNGSVLFEANTKQGREEDGLLTDRKFMTVKGVYEFAKSVDISDVQELLDKQISFNLKIAEEGLQNDYGANIGSTLLKVFGDKDTKILARAYAAAGSDARMSGCVLPVVINSGSGNQGMTVSLPVIIYANMLKVPREKLYRALVLSNLTAIHQKTGIGRLSAYCGAVSAACGSGAAITFLYDGTLEQIEQTITNTLANVSGMVCDGAKPSCAAKIATAVDAAIMGHYMSINNKTFGAGEGLVKKGVEETIQSIGKLASKGMRQTDEEILSIMTEKD